MTAIRWTNGRPNAAHRAYTEGKIAAREGKPMTACPYGMGRSLPARAEWLNGWQEVVSSAREKRFSANAVALGEYANTGHYNTTAHRIHSRRGRVG